VTLLSFAEPGEALDADALAADIPVRTITYEPPGVLAKRVRQLLSIASTKPWACQDVYSAAMQQAITELCESGRFDIVQLESSVFCQYRFPAGVRVVLDEHNIEYELLWRMGQNERSALRRVFNRLEYLRFRRFERRSWTQVDGVLVCSEREVALVREQAPGTPVAVVPNGVDLDYFSPAQIEPEPFTAVFNGVLDYRPNLDAALHLVQDVWPLVLARCPQARLSIIGRAGQEDVSALRGPGVELTGEVPDIRPHLNRAAVVTVPIRIGGGTRLKVVEALALGKPIVSTTIGCEGIAVRDGEHLLIADGARAIADAVVSLFDADLLPLELGRAGRNLVEAEYSWDLAGGRVQTLYDSLLGERVRSR
jgi:glycosyltransferase involved in cell wall biosynthesis